MMKTKTKSKIKYIVGGVIFFGVLLAVAFMLLRRPASVSNPVAILIPTADGVQIKTANAVDYTDVLEQQNISQGTFVRTTATGEATIILADNSIISLDNSSEIQLQNIPDGNQSITNIVQLAGQTWHRVQSVGNGGKYEVQTPSVIAAVRGTTFGVNVTPGQTDDDTASNVYVIESKVGVTPVDHSQDEVQLNPQETITFSKRDLKARTRIAVAKLTSLVLESNWYKNNQQLDSDIKTLDRQLLFRHPELLKAKLRISQLLLDKIAQLHNQIIQKSGGISTTQSTPTVNAGAVFADFNIKYGYPILGQSSCSQITSGAYNQDIINLEAAANGYLPEQEELTTYFAYLNNACNDGKLSQTEYDQVIANLQTVGNHEGNLLHWQTHFTFETEMHDYLVQTLGTDTVYQCAAINSITVDNFMQKIAAIEAKYSLSGLGSDLQQEYLNRLDKCKGQSGSLVV